jgi:hypothetical protein
MMAWIHKKGTLTEIFFYRLNFFQQQKGEKEKESNFF